MRSLPLIALLALLALPLLSTAATLPASNAFLASFSMSSFYDVVNGAPSEGYGFGGENYSFYVLGHQQGSGYAKVQVAVEFYSWFPGWSQGAAYWFLNGLDAGSGGGDNYANIRLETIVPIEDLGDKQELSLYASTRAFPKCIHYPAEIAGCASNEAYLNTSVNVTVFSKHGKQLTLLTEPPGGGNLPGGDPTSVPEPSTIALLVSGLAAFSARKRSK